MYQNNSFYISDYNNDEIFSPVVTSVFKILADSSYIHYCYDDERLKHCEKTIAFIRCTNGQGEIHLKHRKIIIKENQCVFLKFYDIKEYKSVSNVWGYRWINFHTEKINGEFEFNKIYDIPFSENEDNAFNKLLAAGQTNSINKSYLCSLFANYFYSIMIESQMDSNNLISEAQNGLINEMCAYINQKLYSKISIDEIALFFKISPRRLHQIFTNELGISPKKYIIKKKMEEGYKLLVQTSTPINQIAYMLCFSSPYHFTNEFKKIFSQSPSQVRKMEQEYEHGSNK